MYKFSKETGGFYLPELHKDNIPQDAIDVSIEEHEFLLIQQSLGKVIAAGEDGKPVAIDPPGKTDDQILQTFINSIQKRLDDFAKTRGYDGCLSCCTYADSQIGKFATEGTYMRLVRDQHWNIGYQIITDVQAGNREVPTLEQLFIELGPLEWPN